MASKIFVLVFLLNVGIGLVNGRLQFAVPTRAMDNDLFEKVLDEEMCAKQIDFIRSTPMLALQFADAGLRVPRGILGGNTLDMGNYHQCMGLNHQLPEFELQGKYCAIRVPSNQELVLPDWPLLPSNDFDPNMLRLDNETMKNLEQYNRMMDSFKMYTGMIDEDNRVPPESPLSELVFTLAVCIPRPCTTRQAFDSFLFNVTEIGFRYTDFYCRLPNDRPKAPADYAAIAVFSFLGLLTLISTSYDLWHSFVKKTDSKSVSVIGRSFSVYTNGRRLMNFASGPDTVECLDGIRALGMIWVVLGHSYTTEVGWANPLDGREWRLSWKSLWVVAAHYAVDTFFTLSGFLVVYTTVGKLNGKTLLKNIHLFYLNRLLRMFPLLAIAVLFEASYLNHMTDGPNWTVIARQVENCRATWWSTLLHVQNYVSDSMMCIVQTWYLAIDVQLHIISPIFLVWVLWGRNKLAWAALIAGLVVILVASTTYNFMYQFPPAMGGPGSPIGQQFYVRDYYINTLTRGPPFFVGMIYGYLVRMYRTKLTGVKATLYWAALIALFTLLVTFEYPLGQPGWSSQTMTSFYNSFFRCFWAAVVCGVIYACVNGFGGPINWLLSLQFWKIHSRLSYGIYLFHHGLMIAVNYTALGPFFFTPAAIPFKFLAHYSLAIAVSFLLTLVVDAPFSTLFKLLLGGGFKKPPKKDDDDLNEAVKGKTG